MNSKNRSTPTATGSVMIVTRTRAHALRTRSSKTSTRSSSSSVGLPAVVFTASFHAPAGPETSAVARSVRDRGHGGAQPVIGVPDPFGGSRRSLQRVGRQRAARLREHGDALDAQIESAIAAGEAIGVERERELDLLARRGLFELLPQRRQVAPAG